MEESENYSEATYQGNPVDPNGTDGEAPRSTAHSTAEETSTEPKAPRENEQSTDQSQAQVQAQPKMDYEKSYKELEKTYTRDSQRRAQYERDLKEARSMLEQYQAIDQKLVQNPDAMKYLQQLFSGRPQVDPVMQNDPLYKHMEPVLQEVQQMKQYVQSQIERETTTKAENFLDSQVSLAAKEIKSHFERDMTQDDLTKVYNWMQENQNYNGKSAVRDLFWDDFGNAKAQSVLKNQEVKKGMGTTKSTSVNSNAAKESTDKIMTFRQAWKESKKELGIEN